MKARLRYRDVSGADRDLQLADELTYVGRSVECGVRIDDGLTSRRHALLRFTHGRFWVEDLGSANGTYVNEARIGGTVALNHNDTLRCGNSYIRFIIDEEVAAAITPPQPIVMPPAPAATPQQTTTPQGPRMSPVVPPPTFVPAPLPSESDPRVLSLEAELADLRGQAEELARLRNDNDSLNRRVGELRAQLGDGEVALHASQSLADELAEENAELKARTVHAEEDAAMARDDLACRKRQLERAEADLVRAKEEHERIRTELATATRAREANLGKSNEHLAEIEHLREVIQEQCLMLEEQRVQLMVLGARASVSPLLGAERVR